MKITVANVERTLENATFPLFARSKGAIPIIAVFTSSTKGITITNEDGNVAVGPENSIVALTTGYWEILPKGTQIVFTQE